ncbi:hypothetical protein AB205_0027650 [Aquarana catesbeiana]|uniref:Peptidase C1A papain C-terminal domain-containing protein n=1 Tax=Aquarana catesbeiana TaxID=8400 RepID=A0A2G9Q9U1_AQUCT|nr:hypothetical protein AB205_0027650 [Aquarana catesbeiana]
MKQLMNGYKFNQNMTRGATFLPPNNFEAPKQVDWREKGYVTPVKYQEQDCKYDPANKAATDTGFMKIASGDEKALKKAVASVGPISVGIDSNHESFHFYKEGMYCSTKPD